MNKIFLVAIIGIAVLTSIRVPVEAQTPSATNETSVFRLKIWTDQKSYSAQKDFPIHVELTNVSNHDVYVGKDLWTNASPSRVTIAVMPLNGHAIQSWASAVDGVPDFSDFPKALLKWCFSLPPGYSYGSVTYIGVHVSTTDLIPGSYRIRGTYESSGIDANTYFNPLLGHPAELEQLRPESWKGIVGSNELIIKIVAPKAKQRTSSLIKIPQTEPLKM
jgi:hypothetical protein